jgi:hypothetical protein
MITRVVVALSIALATGCYAAHDIFGDSGISSPVTEPCAMPGSGSRRDCGFRVERIVSCRRGDPQIVGCGCDGLGGCSGDPVIRICEGTSACRVDAAIDNVDDTCGLCPRVDFECPPSGQYTILSAPFGSSSYRCDVEVRGGT